MTRNNQLALIGLAGVSVVLLAASGALISLFDRTESGIRRLWAAGAILAGEIKFERGDYRGAVGAYDEGLKQTSDQNDKSLYLAYFTRGVAHEILGGHKDAISDYKKCGELVDRHHKYAVYAPVYSYFSYKEIGDAKSANSVLQECASRSKSANWPYPAVGYLLGQKTAAQFETEATDNGKMTEAKTYIGLNLLLQGQREQGLSYLKWVQEHGNKGYFEFKLAAAKYTAATGEHKPAHSD